jgi:hypothetical protein
MPEPDEVVTGWACNPQPDDRDCVQDWQSCDDCDGEAGPDDKCSMCTGSGGGYICATHDTNIFTKFL